MIKLTSLSIRQACSLVLTPAVLPLSSLTPRLVSVRRQVSSLCERPIYDGIKVKYIENAADMKEDLLRDIQSAKSFINKMKTGLRLKSCFFNHFFFSIFSVVSFAAKTPKHSAISTNGVIANVVALATKPKIS